MGGPEKFTYPLARTKVAWETKKAIDEGYRIIGHQGGTRSGKTYSICDLLIALAYSIDTTISVTSVSFPHLRKGAMRDWMELMEKKGQYDPANHNMTDQLYEYPLGSYIEFFSVDDAGKTRGPGRDILYWNEMNLGKYDIFQQLILRTKKFLIFDYNPFDEFHWIYDKVLTRDDCKLIKTTYKDNPFLPAEQIREIERLEEDSDKNYWNIFGLGERGSSSGRVYTHWHECDLVDCKGEMIYGLDFGYNVPSALVRIFLYEDTVYIDEVMYESHLTNNDLIERLKAIITPKKATIYADAAEPDRIDEIWRAGFNIHPADKSVHDGILELKKRKVFMTRSSVNGWKEYRSYSFKQDKEGRYLDEPVKYQDHLLDAARYAVKSSVKRSAKIVMGG